MKSKSRFVVTVVAGLITSALMMPIVSIANAIGKEAKSQRLPDPIVDQDFRTHSANKVRLGQFLFYDKILSGNKNISCASCHHSMVQSGDGLSLGIGEGGQGMGATRDTGAAENAVPDRVPRNAPPIFNLGAHEYVTMFHDGRVAVDPTQPSGFATPAGDNLPQGFESVLAAQAMFPVASGTEMAGQAGENSVADASAMNDLSSANGVWAQLAQRLREIPEYVQLFMQAFSDIKSADDITMVHAANAIAAFEDTNWRASNTPFDRYLRGDRLAMSESAQRGMRIFYQGDQRGNNCASCHSGKFLTDHQFHAIAMPQIGPGKGDGADGHEDFGRERVTGLVTDRYKFRTPPLRNVALSAPYGHDGAYRTLDGILKHFVDPVDALNQYDQSQVLMPSRDDLDALDFLVMNDSSRVAAIGAAAQLQPLRLNNREIQNLLDFLQALTDPADAAGRHSVPANVPSGLPVRD